VAVELVRYIEWFLTSHQAKAEAVNNRMTPISHGIANRILSAVLQRMTCNGQLLMDLVRHQKYEEEESLKTWKMPVQIVSPMVAVIILLLAAYAIAQRVQYLRTLNRDNWKINFSDIEFAVPRKRREPNNSADTDEAAQTSSANCPGRWNRQEIATRLLSIAPVFNISWKVKQMLMRMREEIGHDNVAKFVGISFQNGAVYLVEQYCANGSLVEFLQDNKYVYSLNQSFRYVACADIANGMAYLHRQNLIHGNLTIDKCHVDSRWTIKIVDWEYAALYDVVRQTQSDSKQATRKRSVIHFLCGQGSGAFKHLAPEVYKKGLLCEPTRAGDIYSFGVIIRDVFVTLPGHELPGISTEQIPVKARQMMELACHETAINRPSFEQLEKSIRSAVNGRQTNLLDRCVHANTRFCLL